MEIDPARLGLLADPSTEDGRMTLRDLFEAFGEDMRTKISRLREALAARDTATVRKIAHEQKGAAGMVGAAGVAGLFLAIERAAENVPVAESALLQVEDGLARVSVEVDEFLRRSVHA